MDTKALRQKILDLAIRGKLVPQDPNDEPASVLLEKIRAEKQQMVKDGKLKPKDIKNDTVIFKGEDSLHYEKFPDGSVKCIEDEIPFELPKGWVWCRFGSYTINRDIERKPVSSAKRSNISKIYDYYGASGAIDKINEYLFSERLLLIGEDGANLVTRSKPIAFFADGKYWVNNHAHCIDAIDKKILDFLCCYINAISLEKYVTGSAQPKMTQGNMNLILIPVPPYEEQKRLIEKLNQCLKLVDYIESSKFDLSTVLQKTKSKILDLAIRGKLVPQDPNDEPASVLLERIRAEKEELIKQGKIKHDKKESVIFKGEDNSYYETIGTKTICIDDEIPFDLPDGWEWSRLGFVFAHNTGKALNQKDTIGISLTYITTSNLYWDRFELNSLKKMNFTESEIDKCTVHKGDLLVCEGGDIGRAAIWNYDNEIRIQNHIHKLRPYIRVNVKLYYYVFYLYKVTDRISGKGIGIQGLSSNQLHNMFLPIPPLDEQKRIADKIDQLFSILDTISSSLD